MSEWQPVYLMIIAWLLLGAIAALYAAIYDHVKAYQPQWWNYPVLVCFGLASFLTMISSAINDPIRNKTL